MINSTKLTYEYVIFIFYIVNNLADEMEIQTKY